MKQSNRLNIRIDPETLDRFSEAARRADVSRSRAIRDLLRAAVEYMDRVGSWYPPHIEPAPPPVGERVVPFVYPAPGGDVGRVVADPTSGQRVQGRTDRPPRRAKA